MLVALWIACSGADEPKTPAATSPPPAPQSSSPQARMHTPGQAPPPPGGPQGSGAAMQDPTGFPPFHSWPAPQGPRIDALGKWSPPSQLTKAPGGGYRPQIASTATGQLHALYYERTDDGDLIRHRTSTDGKTWTDPQHLGHTDNRNWDPMVLWWWCMTTHYRIFGHEAF